MFATSVLKRKIIADENKLLKQFVEDDLLLLDLLDEEDLLFSHFKQNDNTLPESPENSKKNFTRDEDTQICRSWCATSVDYVNGNSQEGTTLWGNILLHFNAHPCTERYVRGAAQLQKRWRIISRETTKWCAAIVKATNNKPSAYTDNDIPKLAQHFYSGVEDFKAEIPHSKLYRLHHCYEVLHAAEKWKVQLERSKSAPNKRRANQCGDSSDDEERPLGNKQAKLALKNQKKSEDVRELIKEQQILRTKLEERKVTALEKSSENERLTVEMNVMMQDTGPGSEERRNKYFEIIQKRIIERMLKEERELAEQSSSED